MKIRLQDVLEDGKATLVSKQNRWDSDLKSTRAAASNVSWPLNRSIRSLRLQIRLCKDLSNIVEILE